LRAADRHPQVGFYEKAGAHDQLAELFEACAVMEVEQYRDYDKALQVGNLQNRGRRGGGGAVPRLQQALHHQGAAVLCL
jgi:hypothetical protein